MAHSGDNVPDYDIEATRLDHQARTLASWTHTAFMRQAVSCAIAVASYGGAWSAAKNYVLSTGIPWRCQILAIHPRLTTSPSQQQQHEGEGGWHYTLHNRQCITHNNTSTPISIGIASHTTTHTQGIECNTGSEQVGQVATPH